jgi:hypothetical protein
VWTAPTGLIGTYPGTNCTRGFCIADWRVVRSNIEGRQDTLTVQLEPSPMYWAVQIAIAIGTVGAVIVALFGNWLRAWLLPHKLEIKVVDPRGHKIEATIRAPSGNERPEDSRWYHVRVENPNRRWLPVTQVQLFLLQVEELDAAGQFTTTWMGEVPLQWRYQELNPIHRTMGFPADCDLLSVVKNKWVELRPLYAPKDLPHRWRQECKFAVTVHARGVEVDSNRLRVEVHWNGEWSDDAEEMSKKLIVR